MRSMSILEEMLEMFATTVQAELNEMLHFAKVACKASSRPDDIKIFPPPFPMSHVPLTP
jgi:hypothetical protein